MKGRKHTVEPIVAKLREAEVPPAKARPVANVVRMLGVTEQIYCRWHD